MKCSSYLDLVTGPKDRASKADGQTDNNLQENKVECRASRGPAKRLQQLIGFKHGLATFKASNAPSSTG